MIVAEAVQHQNFQVSGQSEAKRERGRGEGHHRTNHVLNLSTRLAPSCARPRARPGVQYENAVFLRLILR